MLRYIGWKKIDRRYLHVYEYIYDEKVVWQDSSDSKFSHP